MFGVIDMFFFLILGFLTSDYQLNEWWSLSDVMEAIVFPENIKFAAILYFLIHAHLIFKLLKKRKTASDL